MKNDQAVNYKNIAKYSQTVGAVKLEGMDLQLCDYIEAVNGRWYALAYFNDSCGCAEGINDNGTIVKQLKTAGANDSGLCVAYVPQNLLDQAVPQFDDENNTQMLIDRLSTELSKLNVGQSATA